MKKEVWAAQRQLPAPLQAVGSAKTRMGQWGLFVVCRLRSRLLANDAPQLGVKVINCLSRVRSGPDTCGSRDEFPNHEQARRIFRVKNAAGSAETCSNSGCSNAHTLEANEKKKRLSIHQPGPVFRHLQSQRLLSTDVNVPVSSRQTHPPTIHASCSISLRRTDEIEPLGR